MWSGDFLQIFVVNIQITDWSLLSKNWQDHSYNNHHLFHRKLSKNRYQLLTTKTWTKRQFEVFRVIRHQNAPTCWLKCLNMTQHFYKNCNHISWQEAWIMKPCECNINNCCGVLGDIHAKYWNWLHCSRVEHIHEIHGASPQHPQTSMTLLDVIIHHSLQT